MRSLDELDHALARFQQCGLEYGGGRANHGPMAAEALVQLGHPALLVGFVDVYVPRLPPLPPRPALAPFEQAEALGRPERAPEWIATFSQRLTALPWRDVVAESLAARVDAIAAAGASPWLRVAHALHALAAHENPVRVRELAFGLGYWCAHAAPRRALAPVADPLERIGGLCSAAAERFLAEPAAALREIRVLTAASALRLAAPHLAPALVGRAAAALVAFAAAPTAEAASRSSPPAATDATERRRLAGELAELRYRAACSIEEHCIEFTAACLREHAVSGDARLLEAASDAVLRLDSGRY